MKVQPHLKKCFEGIYTLDFNFAKEIVGMASAEGEVVKLSSSIQPADAKVRTTVRCCLFKKVTVVRCRGKKCKEYDRVQYC